MNANFKYLLMLFGLLINLPVEAETTLVAVAANFTKPMTEIAAEFHKATGHEAKLSFGSSGKFVSQLENGAPFEVFLAADNKNPSKLEQAGLAVPESRFTYAVGKLVLWSANPDFVDVDGLVLSRGGFQHIALADPKLAPYGAAAIEVLKKLNLIDKLSPLFVQGENIAQTYEFINTGNAELGFLAWSQVYESGKLTSGSVWQIPQNLYSPILQDAVLMKSAQTNPAAVALMAFLKSEAVLAIIQKYGYELAK